MTRRPAPFVLAVLLAAGCTSDPTAQLPSEPPTTAAATTTIDGNGCGGRQPLAGCASVVRTVDGDTLTMAIDPSLEATTVRLIGVDTPETHHPHKPVQCYGPEAAAATAELAPPGTRIKVEVDREARDRYGRTLAYLYLPSGRMLNEELVWSGFARTLTIPPNTRHKAELARKQADAKAHQRGLWGACPAPTTTTRTP